MKIGILGGGLTGITLANLLSSHSVEVLEAEKEPGGLCRSFEVNGFRGDYGGHILFSKDKEALSFLLKFLGENVCEVKRENRIYYKGSFVKYPFENDLASVPLEDRYECLYHFLYDQYEAPNNLFEWCYHTFGKGISECYLLPYNKKIWKRNPQELSLAWVERIPKPPKEDVIKSALGITTEGYVHQLYFKYPINGGIGALINQLKKNITIITDCSVKHIESKKKGWLIHTLSGKQYEYDQIISTIPLVDLVSSLSGVDVNIAHLAKDLRYNSLVVALVCISREQKYNFSALYVPDPDIIFHRICYMDYFSPQNSPNGCSSILTEITYPSDHNISRISDSNIAEKVVKDLIHIGQIEKNEVLNVEVKHQKYGYVLNDLGYEKRLEAIHNYLNEIGIFVCGRFGEFRYHNMDACIRSAFFISEKILKGKRV